MSRSKPPLLNSLSGATTKSYNAMINRLCSEGAFSDVLLTYASMISTDTPPDGHTFPSLLKACTSLDLFSHGLSFHQRVIVDGYSSDAYVASSLINFYSKVGHTENARKVFDTMSDRNVVPWTTMIGCYTRAGELDVAFSMHNMMRQQGVHPSPVTMLGMLSGVLELVHLQCLHGCVIRYGFGSDVALANSLLNVYCKCGRVEDAQDLFELMDERDVISWNSLVSGYAQIGNITKALQLLIRMKTNGIEPDQLTYVPLVSAAAMQNELWVGKLVHGHILRAGLELDSRIESSVIGMYLKCGNVNSAFQVFENLTHKDVVTWSAMISGLVQNDCADLAITVFRRMVKSKVMPSTATISSVLAACAELGCFPEGTSVHGYILRQRIQLDIPSQNSLVNMYGKCGHLEQSRTVFDRMSSRDIVSWNAMVSGHAQNGNLFKALLLFIEMRENLQTQPDSVTIVSLLQACASIGALHQGKWIHNFVTRSCLGPCILIDTALVDMYSKCGDLGSAQKCFDRMPKRDLVSWSTIIAGYGSHGKGETALRMYSELLHTGIQPNHVIYLSVLSACSHNGLVKQGLRLFHYMTKELGLEPRLEHRACVVDLLSRAGRVKEAYYLYKRMFPEPSVDVLGILIDACRRTGNMDLGDTVAREIVVLKPTSAGNYVQLAHSYASMKKWDGVGEAWTQMKSLHLKKLPAWSSIELHGTITTFFTGHTSHPLSQEIMWVLKILGAEMRKLDIQ